MSAKSSTLDQSAILKISATGVPVIYAWDVAAPLTLCTLNFAVSITADYNTDMIQPANILGDTGLYGLIKDKTNLETKCPLRNLSASEREIWNMFKRQTHLLWTLWFRSKITQPFPQKSHEFALKLTDLWIISFLFDLNFKYIDGSFAFSPA